MVVHQRALRCFARPFLCHLSDFWLLSGGPVASFPADPRGACEFQFLQRDLRLSPCTREIGREGVRGEENPCKRTSIMCFHSFVR